MSALHPVIRTIGATLGGAPLGAARTSYFPMLTMTVRGTLAGHSVDGLLDGWLAGVCFWPVGSLVGLFLDPLFLPYGGNHGTA